MQGGGGGGTVPPLVRIYQIRLLHLSVTSPWTSHLVPNNCSNLEQGWTGNRLIKTEQLSNSGRDQQVKTTPETQLRVKMDQEISDFFLSTRPLWVYLISFLVKVLWIISTFNGPILAEVCPSDSSILKMMDVHCKNSFAFFLLTERGIDKTQKVKPSELSVISC